VKISVVTRARIGFAIAIGILIGIGEAQAIERIDVVRNNVLLFSYGITCLGLLSWLVGQFSKRERIVAKTEREKYLNEHPLIFLRSFKYWGMILVVVSGFMSYRVSLAKPETSTLPESQSERAVIFPELELQGVIVNGAKSSAIINGQVLVVGEDMGNVKLLEVAKEHAKVGLEGQTKILTFRTKD
jgi:hypothetical protein